MLSILIPGTINLTGKILWSILDAHYVFKGLFTQTTADYLITNVTNNDCQDETVILSCIGNDSLNLIAVLWQRTVKKGAVIDKRPYYSVGFIV